MELFTKLVYIHNVTPIICFTTLFYSFIQKMSIAFNEKDTDFRASLFDIFFVF